ACVHAIRSSRKHSTRYSALQLPPAALTALQEGIGGTGAAAGHAARPRTAPCPLTPSSAQGGQAPASCAPTSTDRLPPTDSRTGKTWCAEPPTGATASSHAPSAAAPGPSHNGADASSTSPFPSRAPERYRPATRAPPGRPG